MTNRVERSRLTINSTNGWKKELLPGYGWWYNEWDRYVASFDYPFVLFLLAIRYIYLFSYTSKYTIIVGCCLFPSLRVSYFHSCLSLVFSRFGLLFTLDPFVVGFNFRLVYFCFYLLFLLWILLTSSSCLRCWCSLRQRDVYLSGGKHHYGVWMFWRTINSRLYTLVNGTTHTHLFVYTTEPRIALWSRSTKPPICHMRCK